MKIKHWQGYGIVDAKKVNEEHYTLYGQQENRVDILVSGNHEWGIVRDDKYDVSRWLLQKFVKAFKSGEKDYRSIKWLGIETDYSGDVEKATYTIIYK